MVKRLDVALVVDLEATCWEGRPPEGQESEIIEIGLCPMDLSTGERLEKRSILVKPQYSEVSAFCTELTTITPEMLEADGVPLSEAARVLKNEYDSKSRLFVSWGDYDRRQLERECKAKGIGYPFGPGHMNAKTLFSLRHELSKEWGMARALEHLGEELVGTHHRGHDDAYNIALLFWRSIRG